MWPPAGSSAVDAGDVYEALAGRGYEYGPAFRGLRALWRRGREVFAEVTAGDGSRGQRLWHSSRGIGRRAACLGRCRGRRSDDVAVLVARGMPACRRGGAGYGSGSRRWGTGAVSVDLADATGLPVLSVRELIVRPISRGALSAALAAAAGGGGGLFEVGWSPVPLSDNPIDDGVVVWEPNAGGDVVDSVYAATHEALGLLQSWLAGDGLRDAGGVDHGAVSWAGEDVTDLAGAAVWGLVRSAQAEQPGRVVLVDSDGSLMSPRSSVAVSRKWWSAPASPTRPGWVRRGRARCWRYPPTPGDWPWAAAARWRTSSCSPSHPRSWVRVGCGWRWPRSG